MGVNEGIRIWISIACEGIQIARTLRVLNEIDNTLAELVENISVKVAGKGTEVAFLSANSCIF